MAWWEVPITMPPPHPAGYSVAVLHKESGLSYLAGAPRHKQRGAVFELQNVGRETNNFVPVLEGEQVPVGEGTPSPPLLSMGIQRLQRERSGLQGTQQVGDTV